MCEDNYKAAFVSQFVFSYATFFSEDRRQEKTAQHPIAQPNKSSNTNFLQKLAHDPNTNVTLLCSIAFEITGIS